MSPRKPLAHLETAAIFQEWEALHDKCERSMARAKEFMSELGLTRRLNGVATLGVVGSKGKGTAAVYASAALASNGDRVGTITSPGVVNNRDRVRIDGHVLDDDQYRAMLMLIIAARKKLNPADATSGYLSPSGLFTLGGLATLAESGCQIAVVEAGIGGLADELSLIPLDVLIVTEIFNEHSEVLGPTIVDIATNKTGIITRRTKCVVSLAQSEVVRQIIENRCKKTSTKLIWVNSQSIPAMGIVYPPGMSRLNAIAGTRAGVVLSELVHGIRPQADELRSKLNSVSYPGRLSVHRTGSSNVIVDSAITRDGLVTALVFARKHFGKTLPAVFLSVPANKDFEGCVKEMEGLTEVRRVFVNMPQSHLPFPAPDQWPWEWLELDDVLGELALQDCLAVGTATYTAHLLELLGADTRAIF